MSDKYEINKNKIFPLRNYNDFKISDESRGNTITELWQMLETEDVETEKEKIRQQLRKNLEGYLILF